MLERALISFFLALFIVLWPQVSASQGRNLAWRREEGMSDEWKEKHRIDSMCVCVCVWHNYVIKCSGHSQLNLHGPFVTSTCSLFQRIIAISQIHLEKSSALGGRKAKITICHQAKKEGNYVSLSCSSFRNQLADRNSPVSFLVS